MVLCGTERNESFIIIEYRPSTSPDTYDGDQYKEKGELTQCQIGSLSCVLAEDARQLQSRLATFEAFISRLSDMEVDTV
jgi:hypothetical protein